MKRFLLSASAALISFSGFSQAQNQAQVSPEIANKKISIPVQMVANPNPQPPKEIKSYPTSGQRNLLEVEIGTSTYDLQSNSAIQWRLINHENGTLSASWTYSNQNSWATRGTGYNFFNGTSWGSAPTSEIETERTGWPSMMATSSGREVIVSHSTASSILRKVERNTIGSGTWAQANQDTLASQVWNRGQASGNTLHVVCMTTPAANGGTVYNGMDGAFLYNRSTDGGISWDIIDYQIPGTDSSYFDGFDGDSYSIDAKGNTVAVVVGGLGRGVQLFKSTNNGVSWTKTDVLLSDVWFVESATVIDTTLEDRLYTSDGNVNVIIDNDGMCHITYGTMYIANADVTDGLITYYPGTNGIDYWNEDYPGPYGLTITGALDLDNSGALEITDWGQYRFAGLASQPKAGIASDGCIYLAYSAVQELLSNGSQNYRHTYVMRSCDGGCSWSEPIDVTGDPANAFSECVYASMARRVDDDVHMVYMSDNEPGIAVSGDEDPVVTNKIFYLKEDVDRFDTTEFCPVAIVGDSELCVGSGASVALYAIGCAASYTWSGPSGFSSSNQVVNVGNLGTYTCVFSTDCGSQTLTFNVVAYSGTGGPSVTMNGTNLNMCPGDTSTLTANTSVGGLSYFWSTGSSDSAIVVTTTGTFTVTVSDCNGGTTVASITITQPTTAPTAVVAGDPTICPGGTSVINVFPVSAGSYSWSTGGSGTSITVSAAGTYTVTVSNCGGSATATYSVTAEPLPVAVVTAPATEGCDGDVLTATASGGDTYEWSDGSTSASISVSVVSTGTYTVTVTNACGDEDTTSINLTIHELPAAPVISSTSSGVTSSQTGGGSHMWYVGGILQSESGSVLGNDESYAGQNIYCIYTDENGCESASSNTVVSVEELGAIATIGVYPNPTDGRFEINFGAFTGEMNVEISNSLGQVVYSTQLQVNANQIEAIDLSGLVKGVYQVSLQGESGKRIESLIIE